MRRKQKTTTLALGSAIALSLAAAPAFADSAHPFQAQTLKSPYLAKAESKPESKPAEEKKSAESKPKEGKGKGKDMKCGEGTCGGKSK